MKKKLIPYLNPTNILYYHLMADEDVSSGSIFNFNIQAIKGNKAKAVH